MKVDGITLLQMDRDEKLKPKTIVRTSHNREYFDDYREYDYYIYFENKQFHRCDENGKLGAKFQDRFLNYDVLRKEFEIIEEKPKEIEPWGEVPLEEIKSRSLTLNEVNRYLSVLAETQQELINGFNYLLKKEDDK